MENMYNIEESHGDEVQNILGKLPPLIIRTGMSIVFIIIIILFIGSYFLKYPDIIKSRIVITTQNPPVSLIARKDGKISKLLIKEKQIVKNQQVVAIIENTAKYNDIKLLEKFIDSFDYKSNYIFNTDLSLGEVQQSYSYFKKLMKAYENKEYINYYEKKIENITQQKNNLYNYYRHINNKKIIKQQQQNISEKQFNREEHLYKKNVYSASEYEKKEFIYLQEKINFEEVLSNLVNIKLEIAKLDERILTLQLQKAEETNNQQIAIKESLEVLKNKIEEWKKKYLIISPIEGIVSLNKFWSENQNISVGEIIASIVPIGNTSIVGRLEIPVIGSGKIKLGQKVNIKLDRFPYMEFGFIKTKIESISLIPMQTEKGIFYSAEVNIPNSLISNYGKLLDFSQEMTGTAEIITEDISLLDRLFMPIKSIWK